MPLPFAASQPKFATEFVRHRHIRLKDVEVIQRMDAKVSWSARGLDEAFYLRHG